MVGATGNVGTSLVDALATEERVTSILGVCRRPPHERPPKTTYVAADVAKSELVHGAANSDTRVIKGSGSWSGVCPERSFGGEHAMETMTERPTCADHGPDLAVLTVEVGGLRCGLPLNDVVELHPVVASVPLPGAPSVVDGAIDVRGSVVAVLDFRTRLGLPARQPILSDHLVVSRVGPRTVALRVDRALDLADIPRSSIDSAEDLAGGGHLMGVARMSDGLVLIHDLATFLSPDEADALDHALVHAGDEPDALH